MVTVFEFLGKEPIENVITCLNYKVDRVFFYGYSKYVHFYKKNLESYLKEKCGVIQVVFEELPEYDMDSILSIMRKTISNEIQSGNKVYFDITGGESLILVAFGILSREYDCPMHIYEVMDNRLIELEEGANRAISKDVMARRITMELEDYIKLHGGVINFNLHKEIKNIKDNDFAKDIDSLWDINLTFKGSWNIFSAFVRSKLKSDESDELFVKSTGAEVAGAMQDPQFSRNFTPKKLTNIIDALAMSGLLLDVKQGDGSFQFRYKNGLIKSCIWDSGSVLELHTYKGLSEDFDDCMIGVHLDWDGIIHEEIGKDVCNEIDVLAIKNGIPTFISCKAGRLNPNTTLHALYELQTVADRFGGKYSKKCLITVEEIAPNYRERADEMNIKLIREKD